MYNPSRGGVRGGADQFTWESVKNDKHRENYLGHSLMAPVGRWQKGKDLSWYAKERKDDAEEQEKSDRTQLASIKKAEEEAMLIALGHNVIRKENQSLSKEEIREALKRNVTQKDDYNIDRVDGVGASGSSKRLALLSNSGIDYKPSQEGVSFEGYRSVKNADGVSDRNKTKNADERKNRSKKSKKEKKEKKRKKHLKNSSDSESSEPVSKHKVKQKEYFCDSDTRTLKKHKKHHKDSYDSDSSNNISKHRKKHKRKGSDNNTRNSYGKSHKKSKCREKDYSSDDSGKQISSKNEYFKKQNKKSDHISMPRRRHDSSESD